MLLARIVLATLATLPLATAGGSSVAPALPTAEVCNHAPTVPPLAVFDYPQAANWWTLTKTNRATWNWTNCPPLLNSTTLTLTVTNNNTALLNGTSPLIWTSGMPATGYSVYVSAASGLETGSTLETWAKPGSGYVLTLTNDNHTAVYATSALFEIKANNATVDPAGTVATSGTDRLLSSSVFSISLALLVVAGMATIVRGV